MVGKVDLVMWTKNGEPFLPRVLKRIEEVIPNENVCQKFIVDDNSMDRTVNIARRFNWDVYPNPANGIPSGANECLRHVERDFFVSVEQDVILAKDWWDRIPPHMNDDKVAVAQGVRVSVEPTLRKLDEYIYGRLKSKHDLTRFGFSIDNNIFRTKVIRQLGGFPTDCPVCCDTVLIKQLARKTRYKWIVDKTVVSNHLRQDVKAYIEHEYALTKLCAKTPYCMNRPEKPFLVMLKLFLTSPMRAFVIAYKKKWPKMLYVYPTIRYKQLRACIDEVRDHN